MLNTSSLWSQRPEGKLSSSGEQTGSNRKPFPAEACLCEKLNGRVAEGCLGETPGRGTRSEDGGHGVTAA